MWRDCVVINTFLTVSQFALPKSFVWGGWGLGGGQETSAVFLRECSGGAPAVTCRLPSSGAHALLKKLFFSWTFLAKKSLWSPCCGAWNTVSGPWAVVPARPHFLLLFSAACLCFPAAASFNVMFAFSLMHCIFQVLRPGLSSPGGATGAEGREVRPAQPGSPFPGGKATYCP